MGRCRSAARNIAASTMKGLAMSQMRRLRSRRSFLVNLAMAGIVRKRCAGRYVKKYETPVRSEEPSRRPARHTGETRGTEVPTMASILRPFICRAGAHRSSRRPSMLEQVDRTEDRSTASGCAAEAMFEATGRANTQSVR